MTLREAIGACIASASTTHDASMRIAYVAAARDILERAKADLEGSERLVVAQERELARIGATT